MLRAIAYVAIQVAPMWSKEEHDGGLIMFPFNAILWPMATQSGYAFFLEPEVSTKLGAITNYWADNILTTSCSQYATSKQSDGWLSEQARTAIEDAANLDGVNRAFERLYKCYTTDEEHLGFGSWDQFLVRELKDIETVRPVGGPGDVNWLASPYESGLIPIQNNVKDHDNFWLKGHPSPSRIFSTTMMTPRSLFVALYIRLFSVLHHTSLILTRG